MTDTNKNLVSELTSIPTTKELISFGEAAQPILQSFEKLCKEHGVKDGCKILLVNGSVYMTTKIQEPEY